MEKNWVNVSFGKAVARRREELDLTQAELAGQVGMSRASIANIEKGRQNVLLHHVYDLADALKLPRVGDLLLARPRGSAEAIQVKVSAGDLSDRHAAQVSELVASVLAAHEAKARS